jgi:hypothetical protein
MFTEKGQLVLIFNKDGIALDIHPIQFINYNFVIVANTKYSIADGKITEDQVDDSLHYINNNNKLNNMKFSEISYKILPFNLSHLNNVYIEDHKLHLSCNEIKSVLKDIETFIKKEDIPGNAKITNVSDFNILFSYNRVENYHEYGSRVFNTSHYSNDKSLLSYKIKLKIDTDDDFLLSGINLSRSTIIDLSFDNKIMALDFINSIEVHSFNERHFIPACHFMNEFKKSAIEAIKGNKSFGGSGNWEYSFSCLEI